MALITVYSTDRCPYCVRVKQLLDKRGFEYDEINLEMDADGRAKLVEKTGLMTFPQVIVGDKLIGGFTETAAADKDGSLAELVAAAA